MTTEEKAKAFDEALEQAKKELNTCGSMDCDAARQIFRFFPQLAESEDERIRKALLKMAKVPRKEIYEQEGITKEQAIAYLERQKGNQYFVGYAKGYSEGQLNPKQKEPHYTKRNALFDKCAENCDPKTVEEVNKRVEDIMNMPELSAFEQALTNFIGYWEDDEEHWPSQFVKKHGKHILDMAREVLQKEQKPVKPSGKLSRQDYLYQLLINQLITYSDYEYLIGQKPADLSEMMVHKEPYIAPVPTPMVADEQKPAEWNEKFIADVFEKVGLAKIVRELKNDALTNAVQSAMIELSKVENTEWSEEDEKIIDTIVSVLGQYIDYKTVSGTGSGYATPKYTKEIDWLNSLSSNLKKKNEDVSKLCSNEWSEEDEEMRNLIVAIFEVNHPNGFFKANELGTTDMRGVHTEEIISWLKSLRPSWKPSEDDIKMLEHIIGQYEIGNKNSKIMGYLPRVEELNFLKKVLAKWKNLL